MTGTSLRASNEWALPVLAVIAALVGVLSRRERSLGSNVWDQVMAVAGDPYLLIFAVVPVGVLVAMRRGLSQAQETIRVRFGSGLRWLRAVALAELVFASQCAGLLLLVGVVTSIGLPWQFGWSDVLLAETGPIGLGPLPMVALSLLMWVVGLSLLMTITTVTRRLSWRPAILLGPLCWGLLVVSFRTSVPAIDVLSVPFRFGGRVVQRGVVEASLGGAATLVVLAVASAAIAAPEVVRILRPAHYVWALGVVAILLVATVGRLPDGSWLEEMWRTFYGAERGRLSSSYLVYCVSFVGAAYIMLLRLETSLSSEYALRAVRFGSARQWWLRQLRGWLGVVVLWPIVLVTVAATALALADRRPSADAATWTTLFHLTVNGGLQLLVDLIVVGMARWFSARPEGGLAGLGAVVVLGSVRIPPFALNSASVVVESQMSVFSTTAILVATVLGLTLLSLLLVDRRGAP